jgi:hypothetical protein
MSASATTTVELADLLRATWAFGVVGSDPYAPQLRLFADGRIGGYGEPNEKGWELRDGVLVFLDFAHTVSTRFDEISRYDGGLTLTGSIRGSSSRHYLREVAPVGALVTADEGATLVPRPGSRRRSNLVVLCAGPKSLHREWTRNIDEADRTWDLCLSWYADRSTFREDPDARFHVVQTGLPKFLGLARLLYEGSPIFDYDYVMFPDDDLAWDWRGVNIAFESMREYGLMLGQPSLLPEGYPIHEITVRNEATRLRFTNFVEVMTPVFSREALRICAPTFGLNRSGFGLDHIWPRLIGNPRHQIAIIDDSYVVHTRPQGLNYNMGEAIEEGRVTSAAFGANWRYAERGCIWHFRA